MLQALFDWACSWTEVVSASYRPRPLALFFTAMKYYAIQKLLFYYQIRVVSCDGWKSLPVHSINDVIFSIPNDLVVFVVLITTTSALCRVTAEKVSLYILSMMLYFRSLMIWLCLLYFSVYSMLQSFSNWVVPVLSTVGSPSGYDACFYNFSFDVLSLFKFRDNDIWVRLKNKVYTLSWSTV